MKREIKLEKSSMAFKLESGDVLLISNEDVEQIADKLIVEMMIKKQNVIYMLKNNSIEKCNLLYKIITEQNDKITNAVRMSYLKQIHDLLKNDDGSSELDTLKEKINRTR